LRLTDPGSSVECTIDIEQRATSSVPTWRGFTVYGETNTQSQFGEEFFNCKGIYFKVDANNFGARVGWYYYIWETSGQETNITFPIEYQNNPNLLPVSQGTIGILKNASSSSSAGFPSLGAGDWLFSNATAEFGANSAPNSVEFI
jgi:hypothetical protein